MNELNSDLFSEYVDGYFGAGNLQSPIWFVGMEPGEEPDVAHMVRKLNWWEGLGKPPIAGIEPPEVSGPSTTFRNPNGVKIQRTLGRLILYLLAAKDLPRTRDDVREYQNWRFGETDGDAAWMELSALSSKDGNSWPYHQLTDLPDLQTREAYRNNRFSKRLATLRELIEKHSPRVVVCYTKDYWNYYTQLTSTAADWSTGKISTVNCKQASVGGTTFMLIDHPAVRSFSNQAAEEVGKVIRQHL